MKSHRIGLMQIGLSRHIYTAVILVLVLFGTAIVVKAAGPEIDVLLHVDIGPVLNTGAGSANVTVTNTGDAPLEIGSIEVSNPPDFSIVDVDCLFPANPAVIPGGNCTFQVQFSSSLPVGGKSATISINSNAAPQPVTISAVAETFSNLPSPPISIDAVTLDFGEILVGTTSSEQTVTLAYSGSSREVLIVPPAGLDFELSENNCNVTLVGDDQCTFKVQFSPTMEGARTDATVAQTYNPGPGEWNFSVALIGRGTAPKVELSSDLLDFGPQAVNILSDSMEVTVSNTGTGDLLDIEITSSNIGEFPIVADNCTGSIVPKETACTFEVAFRPRDGGPREATISITSNADSSPDTVTATGIGVLNVPAVSQLGLGMLGMLLLAAGAWAVSRRKKNA